VQSRDLEAAILTGFAASGLFPFNPDRVLRSMPPPPAEQAIPKADEVRVGPCRQDVELQTPVTPVSAEALMSLQNLIIQRDAMLPIREVKMTRGPRGPRALEGEVRG
jgi:hypothetical protein